MTFQKKSTHAICLGMTEIIQPVILCGGSGTRLWPLSRSGFPKQFLCLAGTESLFQQAAIPARLFYVPLSVLKFGSVVLKKPGMYQRLCGSVQIDIDKTRQLLGWSPPVPVNEGLRRAAKGLAP